MLCKNNYNYMSGNSVIKRLNLLLDSNKIIFYGIKTIIKEESEIFLKKDKLIFWGLIIIFLLIIDKFKLNLRRRSR